MRDPGLFFMQRIGLPVCLTAERAVKPAASIRLKPTVSLAAALLFPQRDR